MIVRTKYLLLNSLLLICLPLLYTSLTKNIQTVEIKESGADDWGAMPSPDGSQIAFYSTRGKSNGMGRIFIMEQDGSGLHELSYKQTGGHDAEPHWSPDGQFIAFTCQKMVDSIHTSQIYIMRSDGSDLKMHWNNMDPMGASHFGEWYDDGTGYVFAYWKGDFNPNVYAINLDKSDLRKLTNDNMSYKPYYQNEKIWFTSDRNGKPELFKMNTDGTNIENISLKSGKDFMFGSLITSRFYFGQAGSEANSTAFYSMNLEGDSIQKIVEVPTSPAMFFNASQDQKYMVYTTPGPLNYDIHKVDLASGKIIKLIHDK